MVKAYGVLPEPDLSGFLAASLSLTAASLDREMLACGFRANALW